jgi:hypothetical protein
VTGNVKRVHSTKAQFGITPGPLVGECWIGINALEIGTNAGFYAAACNAESEFTVSGLPPGTYQLVVWDFPLDYIFYFTSFIVTPGATVDLTEQIFLNAWFGNLKGTVFYDEDQNGYRDPGEVGIENQNITLRWRDGSIYQPPAPTDLNGEWALNEVFPLFNYVIEVDLPLQGNRQRSSWMTAVM